MSADSPRLRFAPSPTGSLHLGNARTALFNWLVARRRRGTLILRIEDTDTERAEEGSEDAIIRDLRWLGLDWDEGPDVGGPAGPYRQSERGDRYARAIEDLFAAGRAYRCFCSDDDLVAERRFHPEDGRAVGYSGRCREIPERESEGRAAAGERFAVRFMTIPRRPSPGDLVVRFHDRLRGETEFPAVELGDPVLQRRDGRPTYNFAVVVDDRAMGVDLVLRGDDHLSNTPRQVLIFRALGAELPEFAHLPMVLGPDGERLSKRHGATSVSEFRRAGYPPEALVNALALMGWAPSGDRTIVGRDDILAEFELARVGRSAAIFDPAKFDWIAGQHMHALPLERVVEGVAERLVEAALLPADASPRGAEWLDDLADLLRPSIHCFGQVPERCAPLFYRPGSPMDEAASRALSSDGGAAVVLALRSAVTEEEPDTPEAWGCIVERLKRETRVSGKNLFHPVRAALTGTTSGLVLDRLVPLIARGHRTFPDHVASLSERIAGAAIR